MKKLNLKTFSILLALVVGGVNGAWAQSPNETYDFETWVGEGNPQLNMGSDYTAIRNGQDAVSITTNSGTHSLTPGWGAARFAFKVDGNGWQIGSHNNLKGLQGFHGTGGSVNRGFAIRNLWNGDRVKIYFSQGALTFNEANSAKVNGSFVTAGQEVGSGVEICAVKTGDILFLPTMNRTFITKVEFYYTANGMSGDYSISFSNSSITMNVGETYNSNPTVNPTWTTPTFTSSNPEVASVNEYGVVTALKRGTVTITGNLDIGPEGQGSHQSAQFTVTVNNPNAVPKYAYDPAIEVYNLTGHSTWTISEGESAGYSFRNHEAKYISNPYAYELNNRIAIQTTLSDSWTNSNGLKNSGSGLRLIGISNLRDGDRVKVTFSENAYFSSDHNSEMRNFAASGKVFYDIDNDGEQDCEEDVTIAEPGTPVVSDAWYTMLEPGHLDIAFAKNAVITKIEIYSDRKAAYIDTENNVGSHTLTFDGTGQLLEKTAYIPGLKVEFSDANSQTEYIHITQSDKGPVACGEDPDGFKMVLQNENKIPSTGTFYKFIPEVNGTLNIDFKALSVKYGNKIWNHDSSEETVTSDQCYYVMLDVVGNDINVRANIPKGNGAYVQNFNNGFNLVKGHTYYFYGWWAHSTDGLNFDGNQINGSCGVAKLISATYQPAFQMPVLAAVGTNGMTSFDGSKSTPKVPISGNPTNLRFDVKRTSANISVNANDISLEDGYLKISSITYNDQNKDKAGVILVKATADEGEHVFALTIPYSAAYNTDANGNSEGHTWNFTDQPLEIGNYFSDFYAIQKIQEKQKLTDAELAAAAKNSSSQLYNEIEKSDGTTDWTFTYRMVGSNGTFKDPMFQNVYNMEGDNADMIWETEGLWFDTPSNKSAIMNERLGAISNYKSGAEDPDRYVAILPVADGSSSFTIPGLKKDDRVIIVMGSGDGSSTDACFLNITNACDAVHNEINPADTYKAGGSLWDLSGTEYGYRACYNFFAKKDGPMTFKMVGGSMCKIYSIEIYRGERRQKGNGVLGARAYFGSQGDGDSGNMSMNLHFRGKGESLANGTNVSNEVLCTSGNIAIDGENKNLTTSTNGNSFIWSVKEGTFGMAKVRLKCMEYNQKYVTDFADWNVTVGYKQKVDSYPYTWDFTDMQQYSGEAISGENTSYPETELSYEDKGWDLSMWDADGKMILRNPNNTANCNQIFEQNKNGNGNQLYAGNQIIPETKGLWFYFDNNDAAYNGCMQIAADGLHLANASYENGATCDEGVSMRRGWWNYKMVVPSVPAGAAVYLRMARDESVKEGNITFKPWSPTNNKYVDVTEPFFYKKFQFEWMSTKAEIGTEQTDICKYYQASDGTGDYIVAIKNSGETSNLTFTLNGWILKKLAISTDPKTVNKLGWNTESRDHAIDPSLLPYMTGKDFRTYIVTGVSEENKTATLARIDGGSGDDLENTKGKLYVPGATDGSINACIVRYVDANAAEDAQTVNIFNDNNGFHLFVPDMHDDATARNTSLEGNKLKAQVSNTETSGKKVPRTENGNNNYAFTFKYVKVNGEGGATTDQQEGVQAFYRIVKDGASSKGNQAYLSIPQVIASSRAAVRAEEAAATPESYTLVFKDWYELEGEKGDVNGDGLVNEADMELAKDYVTVRKSNGLFKRMGDMNDDGNVDIVDLTLLIQKIMGE